MLYFVAACSFFDEPTDATDATDVTGQAAALVESAAPPATGFPEEIPPDPSLGVREVQTPANISRIAERRVQVPNRQLDIRVDFDHGDYATMVAALSRWGFTLRDADGETARVMAPAGERWPERLEVLPEIARVSETLAQDTLPDGTVRAGNTKFDGGIIHQWSVPEGGVVETVEGAALPRKAEIPRTLPAAIVRCLAPLRSAILDGEPAGVGWERALRIEPVAWVAVVEHYGACDATGWFVMEAMAEVETLTIAGQAVKSTTDEQILEVAQTYLSVPRARVDESAIAASDLLRRLDDTRLAAAIDAVAPGPHQERLFLALAERNESAATALARASTSPTVRAWGAGTDDQVRDSVLADPAAPAEALVAAMAVWRPGTGDEAKLDALTRHVHPAVRMRAWEIAIDVRNAPCLERLAGAKSLDLAAAQLLYAECPQQPVRLQAFSRLAVLNSAAAAAAVQSTLERPETVRAGISAVRAANSLERDDLLEAIVANPLGDRDVRAEALRTLLRVGRSAAAAALFEAHGPFLGVRTAPAKAVAGDK